MSDTRRKNVRFDDQRSKSSRASTVGGSSTTSSGRSEAAHSVHSAHSDQYADQRYNIAALEDTLQRTINELDDWKNRAIKAEELLRKNQEEFKARSKALQHSIDELREDKKFLEKETKEFTKEIDSLQDDKKDLREKNSRLQRKIEKLDSQSEPSSPDSSKPRRHESKRSKESEQKERLKERLNKHSGESSNSEISSSVPPSIPRTPHRTTRRMSTSTHHAEKPYVEKSGPKPKITIPESPNPSSFRRADNYVATSGYPVQSPASGAIPRSAGMVRPSVEYSYPPNTGYREDGNYHAHPLPPRP